MDFVQMGLLILLAVAIIGIRKVVCGYRDACFLIEIYDSILSFEWKPSEEIGKRINASQHELIANTVNRLYKKESLRFESREDFCKVLASNLLKSFEQVGWSELRSQKVTKEWLAENAFLLRELSEKEKMDYLATEASMAKFAQCSKEAGEEEQELKEDMEELIALMEESGIFDLILARKKPGGKRPPKLSGIKARKVLSGLSGAHA